MDKFNNVFGGCLIVIVELFDVCRTVFLDSFIYYFWFVLKSMY